MSGISFFTPISYENNSSCSLGAKLLETVDNYFYLGGKKAFVIRDRTAAGQEQVVLSEGKPSLITGRISLLVTVAKVISYITPIMLAMLFAKAILRATHRFHLVDPQEQLEKDVAAVCKEAPNKIAQSMTQILNHLKNEIEWLSSDKSNLVFKLPALPGFVLKTSLLENNPNNYTVFQHFTNMVTAKRICLAHGLHLLEVPAAKMVKVSANGQEYVFIVEKDLGFNREESVQEELHQKHSRTLYETIGQLAIFVAKTGFHRFTWGNIAVLDQNSEGPKSIALNNLMRMDKPSNGFSDLIECISASEQLVPVISEARKQGVPISSATARLRMLEIEADKKLRAFYLEKGITANKEPIVFNFDSLGLDLNETKECTKWGKAGFEQQSVTLGEVVAVVTLEINRQIRKSSNSASAKRQRTVYLDRTREPFRGYDALGIEQLGVFTEENGWVSRILQALVDKKYIFGFKVEMNQYVIQA